MFTLLLTLHHNFTTPAGINILYRSYGPLSQTTSLLQVNRSNILNKRS